MFSNGEHRTINFERLFREVFKVKPGAVEYPLLQNPELFAQVRLEGLNLQWPGVGLNTTDENGDPVFYPYEIDPVVLYQHSERDPSMDIDLAQMIKSLRLEQGLTQAELAEKSGTTKQYISRIENNQSDIEFLTLKRIVEAGLGRQLQIQVK